MLKYQFKWFKYRFALFFIAYGTTISKKNKVYIPIIYKSSVLITCTRYMRYIKLKRLCISF